MFINVSDKKDFLVWLVNNVSFSQREILWILNYLINHEAILNNVHFVEQADKTDRGVRVASAGTDENPISLFLAGKEFTDTDQVFHEIRMNWKKDLYLECIFEDSWQNSQYLSILEDNPYAKWNEQISEDVLERINEFFNQEEKQAKIDLLYSEIDLALENKDQDGFLKLSDELNQFKKEKKTNI
ncbi:ReoY family proteolytic degradation factor [Enterococcus sp. LJL99]